MIKKLFGKTRTTKADVVMAAAGALVGVWKAIDTYRDYKIDQEEDDGQSRAS